MAYIDFNAQDIPEDTGPEPLPAGDYLIYVESSEVTQDEHGTQKLSMVARVIQPEHFAGRVLFPSFTMQSSNQNHVKVGQSQLALLCRSVGVIHPRDSEELHDKPFFTRVVPKTSGTGKVYSNLTTFWSTASQAPPPPKTAPRATMAQQPAHPGRSGYAPPAQPWQQPAPQQPPQQSYQPPVQQHMSLETQYKGGAPGSPIGIPPQNQFAQPAQVPQRPQVAPGTPPWAVPQQPPQQSYQPQQFAQPAQNQADPPTMYDEQGNRIPY